MSTTLCIKYALAHVTVADVTWIFNELFGEELVTKINEVVKQDRYNGKDFKMFFIECDQDKQSKGNLDRLAAKIKQNLVKGDKRGARVSIDEYGHYWQVSFAIEKPKPEDFKPRIMDEPSVEDLEKAMEALQTDDEKNYLHGRKRAVESGEIVEPKFKRENIGGAIFETVIQNDDPIILAALQDTMARFGLPPPPN